MDEGEVFQQISRDTGQTGPGDNHSPQVWAGTEFFSRGPPADEDLVLSGLGDFRADGEFNRRVKLCPEHVQRVGGVGDMCFHRSYDRRPHGGDALAVQSEQLTHAVQGQAGVGRQDAEDVTDLHALKIFRRKPHDAVFLRKARARLPPLRGASQPLSSGRANQSIRSLPVCLDGVFGEVDRPAVDDDFIAIGMFGDHRAGKGQR